MTRDGFGYRRIRWWWSKEHKDRQRMDNAYALCWSTSCFVYPQCWTFDECRFVHWAKERSL